MKCIDVYVNKNFRFFFSIKKITNFLSYIFLPKFNKLFYWSMHLDWSISLLIYRCAHVERERERKGLHANEYRSDFVSSWDDHDSKTKSKVKHIYISCRQYYRSMCWWTKKRKQDKTINHFLERADESNQETGWKGEE
jgi:hypothetical protein